jgi:hypothetical protein
MGGAGNVAREVLCETFSVKPFSALAKLAMPSNEDSTLMTSLAELLKVPPCVLFTT